MAETFEHKTERNRRITARWDQLCQEGKHGVYESLYRLVGEEVSAETQRRERFEEEVDCARMMLDDAGVPRADSGGNVYSLVGRIKLYKQQD